MRMSMTRTFQSDELETGYCDSGTGKGQIETLCRYERGSLWAYWRKGWSSIVALSVITSKITSALVIWNCVQHQRFNVNQKKEHRTEQGQAAS